jgi:hypothetical protein
VFQVLPKIILQPLVSILIVLITVGLAAGQTLLYSDNSTKWLHCKKGTDFTVPTPGGMIPIKLSLAGNNLIIPRQREGLAWGREIGKLFTVYVGQRLCLAKI